VHPGPGVLANDRGADGDQLHVALGTPPAPGTLRLHSDGSLCYRPQSRFVGKDQFTYWAIDTRAMEGGPFFGSEKIWAQRGRSGAPYIRSAAAGLPWATASMPE
jgi:hypothetical protein